MVGEQEIVAGNFVPTLMQWQAEVVQMYGDKHTPVGGLVDQAACAIAAAAYASMAAGLRQLKPSEGGEDQDPAALAIDYTLQAAAAYMRSGNPTMAAQMLLEIDEEPAAASCTALGQLVQVCSLIRQVGDPGAVAGGPIEGRCNSWRAQHGGLRPDCARNLKT